MGVKFVCLDHAVGLIRVGVGFPRPPNVPLQLAKEAMAMPFSATIHLVHGNSPPAPAPHGQWPYVKVTHPLALVFVSAHIYELGRICTAVVYAPRTTPSPFLFSSLFCSSICSPLLWGGVYPLLWGISIIVGVGVMYQRLGVLGIHHRARPVFIVFWGDSGVNSPQKGITGVYTFFTQASLYSTGLLFSSHCQSLLPKMLFSPLPPSWV